MSDVPRNEINDKFAVLYTQEEDFWTLASDTDWESDKLNAAYDGHCAKIAKFKAENYEALIHISAAYDDNLIEEDVQFFGFQTVSKQLKKEFGDAVNPDNAGTVLSIYVARSRRDDVITWLTEHHPKLELYPSETSGEYNEPFGNWTEARAYTKKHKIEVPDFPHAKEARLAFGKVRKAAEALEKAERDAIEALDKIYEETS